MTLDEKSYEHARRPFEAGRVRLDVGDDRSEHHASAGDEDLSSSPTRPADKGAER